MPKIIRILIALAVAVAIAVAAVRYGLYKYNQTDGLISASGTIEATEVEIAAKVTGRIERIHAAEGERVEAGRLLVEIDRREWEAQVGAAEAQVAAARANLADIEAGSREQEIKKAEAAMEEAAANLEKTRVDFQRLDRLHKDRVVSDQEWERAKTSLDVAAAREREAAEHAALLKAGARREVIEAARGELKRAQAQRAVARVQLDNTRLTAPMTATVLVRSREAGELATVGAPILTLGDLDRLWVKIYIKETDLGRVKLGQAADIRVDSFPEKSYAGRVSFISSKAEFTPKTIQTKEERVKMVFEVKVELENQNGELKPGMPADVELAGEARP